MASRSICRVKLAADACVWRAYRTLWATSRRDSRLATVDDPQWQSGTSGSSEERSGELVIFIVSILQKVVIPKCKKYAEVKILSGKISFAKVNIDAFETLLILYTKISTYDQT